MRVLRGWVWIGAFFLLPVAGYCQNLQLADSLNRQGMEFYESGQYRQAEFYLKEAFNLYKKRRQSTFWLSPGIDYAEILVDRSKYDQALTLFGKLNEVAIRHGNVKARARIENDLGWTYNNIDKNELALAHFKQAIPLAKQARDTLRLGFIDNNIGSIYFSRGDYKHSLEYRKKSLSYLNKLNEPQSIAIALNNIGLTYEKIALYDKALEYYQRSLKIRKELNNAGLLATLYDNLAGLYKDLGQIDQALVPFQKSLHFAREAGNPSKIATTLNNIGTQYSKLGQTERALVYYRQSLELAKDFGGTSSRASYHKNIASMLWKLGKTDQAVQQYEKALALRKQAGRPYKIALSLLDLGHVEISGQNFSIAKNYIDQARDIADSLNNNSLKTKSFYWLGMLESSQGDHFAAITYLKKALAHSRSLPKDAQLEPLKQLALTYSRLQSDSTLGYGRQAIDIIEEQRSQTGPLSKFKFDYFKQHVDFYKAMAAWQLQFNHDISKAYHYIQLAKSRVLNDELAAAAQRIDETLPEEARIKRSQRRSEISHLYSQLKRTSEKQKETALKDKIRRKELAYASFENGLQKQYPKFHRLKSPEPINLQQVRDMCGEETAVIEYTVTDQYLVTYFITRDDAYAKRLPLHKVVGKPGSHLTHLAKEVNQFRQAVLAKAPEDSLAALSAPLYQKLIAPFKKQLGDYTNLMVVPDGYLAYLPFEALKKDKKDNYLVSKYNIKYEPSMTGFSYLKAPDRETTPKLLAVGNAAGRSSNPGTPLLPSVGMEIESISRLFNHADRLEDQQVTEANVKKMMSGHYSYIHVAAHSEIDEQNSFLSGIALNQQYKSEQLGDDGYLRSSEIYGLNMSANLVVLSACKSAMGTLVHGEGLLGLQRAFLNAGASSVMVSLWNVYDRSTARFMTHFYRSLLKQKKFTWSGGWRDFLRAIGWDRSIPFGQRASALRATKLSMLHSAAYHHPVYWAPFVMMGR